ncbi:MAG: DUF1501 domain-containing protein [Planctomycetaceae bacterium]
MDHAAALHQQLLSRRLVIQSGAAGMLGLGLKSASANESVIPGSSKSCIYIFLSGGLAQHESFDPKPDAPDQIRGEFSPIATRTPGLHICEHLPLLAQRSHLWGLCRSLTHPYTGHSQGHLVMLAGRTPMPVGFDDTKPMPGDWPSIAAIVSRLLPKGKTLPSAAVLPETLVHRTGRVIPGQFGGTMGSRWDPWFIEASTFNPVNYGAVPEYGFHFESGSQPPPANWTFQAPSLTLPDGLSVDRLERRLELLGQMEERLRSAREQAAAMSFDRQRQAAVSLSSDPQIRQVVDVVHADSKQQDRYGRNSFGWSLLMARNLVEAGVRFVQVNLGNNETWDTHQSAFPVLKDNLLPPTDKALSALLDDLSASGRLNDTLIVMAGEFGRTPRISKLAANALSGRDHWGPAQSVLLAGAGIQGGTVIGSTDKSGGYPQADAQTPESLAATIYQTLGIPDEAVWHDDIGRPHNVYYGQPIPGLL